MYFAWKKASFSVGVLMKFYILNKNGLLTDFTQTRPLSCLGWCKTSRTDLAPLPWSHGKTSDVFFLASTRPTLGYVYMYIHFPATQLLAEINDKRAGASNLSWGATLHLTLLSVHAGRPVQISSGFWMERSTKRGRPWIMCQGDERTNSHFQFSNRLAFFSI